MAPKTQVQQTYAQAVQENLTPLVSTDKNAAVSMVGTVKEGVTTAAYAVKNLLDKYPPLKAFVYTLAGAAAVPLAVFTGYGLLTAAVMLTIAAVIIGLAQGGFLAFGGFVLFWFLAGAVAVACILTFWFTLSYFALQVIFL